MNPSSKTPTKTYQSKTTSAPMPKQSSATIKFATPEIRVGLEAVKPYKSPKEGDDIKKVKADKKKTVMPGKPAKMPARKPARGKK